MSKGIIDVVRSAIDRLDMGLVIQPKSLVHQRLRNELTWFLEGESDPIDDAIVKLDNADIDVKTALDLHDIAESKSLSPEQKTRLHLAINLKLNEG